jgi:hypothetical protein
MKKTTISLAALAISASTSFALIMPGFGNTETKTYCLSVYSEEDGGMGAGGCDQTRNNTIRQLPLMANGCAEGQVSMYTGKREEESRFPIEIHMCMPPNAAQL